MVWRHTLLFRSGNLHDRHRCGAILWKFLLLNVDWLLPSANPWLPTASWSLQSDPRTSAQIRKRLAILDPIVHYSIPRFRLLCFNAHPNKQWNYWPNLDWIRGLCSKCCLNWHGWCNCWPWTHAQKGTRTQSLRYTPLCQDALRSLLRLAYSLASQVRGNSSGSIDCIERRIPVLLLLEDCPQWNHGHLESWTFTTH